MKKKTLRFYVFYSCLKIACKLLVVLDFKSTISMLNKFKCMARAAYKEDQYKFLRWRNKWCRLVPHYHILCTDIFKCISCI